MANKEVFATTPKVAVTREPIKGGPAPLQVRIYAKDGSSQDVFPVDAKESVASGEYSYEPPTAEQKAAVDKTVASAESTDLDSMTKAELQALADERGVQVNAAMTKAEMIEALSAGGA